MYQRKQRSDATKTENREINKIKKEDYEKKKAEFRSVCECKEKRKKQEEEEEIRTKNEKKIWK